MQIIHPYTSTRLHDQEETKAAIRTLEQQYGYYTQSVFCDRHDSYWEALATRWGEGDIIIIEQDIVPMYDHLHQLATCGFPACTVPYRLNGHMSVGKSEYEDTLFVGPTGPTALGILQPVRTDWYDTPVPRTVEVSSLGLVKISKELQDRININLYPVPDHHWSLLDTWLSGYMDVLLGVNWHVHTPLVKHNHDNDAYYAQASAEAAF